MINLLRLTRPLYLLVAALTYFLGAAVSGYLGNRVNPVPLWLGLVAVLLLQATMFLLGEVFRSPADPILSDETLAARRTLRSTLLYTAIINLAALALLGFALFHSGNLSQLAVLFLFISLAAVMLYGVPPFRLVDRGFGEVVLAIQVAYVVPGIAYILQTGQYHRLLAIVVFPLTLLALACLIALTFPTYAQDRKFNRGTMLVRIGWERAVPLHHVLILAAYLILLAAPFFGISLALLWPAFLTLPFALLQIISLRSIAMGGRPIWAMLRVTAAAVFTLTAYFMTLTFWLR
ncbi:MAG TPA: UbiA family prenyltransferase [Anaerolineales bacterium]